MTTAKEFIEKVEGKKIVRVELQSGYTKDMDCGRCQFYFETEDGYEFVG